ncbi:MAG: SGNH/GDSL hydrolase family protein [Lamprobacter sp.]|uniref:SGNH/GDSL hydrolase family protein n=1 Tax=Lamprobacter sp. TaxID=3100796 RepID=UPI002B261C6B|nr:SGNH/GDSL hydrolase family protein [Lamprobacter sp.]MEA3642690.1 SGNH/GDSL hydrolase family protein [Lamprobacter sp.]
MKRPLRPLLLTIIWLLFVFLLLQLAGFLFYQFVVSQPISGYGYPTGLERPHAELGYHYQPNFSGHFKGTAYQHILIETNAQGFRDADFAPQSGEGLRVAVLGDSVVLGPGVEAGERLTNCLDDVARPGAEAWRILNLGVHAYSFGHYVKLAELEFLGAEPDAVLLGITLNDFAPMESVGPARRARRQAEGWHKPDWVARIQSRLGRTYAGRFLDELDTRVRYALMSANDRQAYHSLWMRSVVDAWQQDDNRERFARRLDQFTAALDQRSLPLGILLFPELNALRDPETFDGPRQQVRAMLDERGLNYCDPYDDFARQPDLDALFLQRDSVHFTPRGHQLICDAFARCLEAGSLADLAAARTGLPRFEASSANP